jgi:hypothetical protein
MTVAQLIAVLQAFPSEIPVALIENGKYEFHLHVERNFTRIGNTTEIAVIMKDR